MQIGFDSNINFTARNITIRKASDIAMKTNKCFPRISATLVEDWHVISSNKRKMSRFTKKLDRAVDEMREYKAEIFYENNPVVDQMRAFIEPVRKYKIGNCGESAQLAAIVAKVNGIQNARLAEVYTKCGKDLDHMVVYVDDEKPYIIDAWLGIADYVPKIIERYKSEFRHHFELPSKCDGMKFEKLADDYYGDALSVEFSRRQKNKLLKFYPDMLIRTY